MSTTAERVGKNEALFREVNERIMEMSDQFTAFAGDDEALEFVCECSDPGCHTAVRLRPADYEVVRRTATTFLVAPEHVWNPEHEAVVHRNDTYWTIEKRGQAAEAASEHDPSD